jgi:ribosomal protein L16 Arg81 hydroxylase
MIERLLGSFPLDRFMDEHFLKLPFSLPHAARDFCDLGSWGMVESIFEQPGADVLIVKDGRRWEGSVAPPFDRARELYRDGFTLVLRHAERHDPQLQQLAAGFERDFRGPVDIQLYCTPASQFGFGWHYDAEDVFIIQTSGSKEYSLRKNTVNPWPLAETLPADMRYEREIMPLINCLLSAGDWLYIPNGYWHMAKAKEESISLAVGVLTASALDVFDFLRGRLLDSLRWRQRLPCSGDASPQSIDEQVANCGAIFADLGADLDRMLNDENFIRAFASTTRSVP